MYSFDYRLKQHNAEWRAQKSPGKKIARRNQVALKVMLVMFFSRNGLTLDHTMPGLTTVNGQYFCALLRDIVSLSVRCKQRELLEHGVVLLRDTTTRLRHRDVQNLVQRWGWEVLAYPTYFPDLAPCDCRLFAHVE